MKKTILKLTLFIALIGVSTFLVSMIYRKMETKKTIANNVKMLPKIQLKGIDNKSFMLENSTKKHQILLFFNTECEHCQNEAKEIKKHINEFENSQLTFISIEPVDSIKNFVFKYQLYIKSNIKFAHIEAAEVGKQFGISSFPTIFIYNQNNELVKQYKGETKIEAITKFINK